MKAERQEQLSMLASSIAGSIAFQLPLCEESSYVARRVMAMILGNAIDLDDMVAKGLTIDQAMTAHLDKLREEARAVVQYRMVHEHAPTGTPN